MTPLEDELAAALRSLLVALNGFKGCPSLQKIINIADANGALAKYAAAKAQEAEQRTETTFQLWMRDKYPDLWLEWVGARTSSELWHCIAWAEAQHPDVRGEYVKMALDITPQKPYNEHAQTGQ